MAGLFALYFISLLLVVGRWRNTAFALMIVNLILSFLVLLYQTTDIRLLW